MIEAEFSDLELLADNVASISSEMDELYIKMKLMYEEIIVNLELQAYPQYNSVCESLAQGVNTVFRMNEILMTLKNIMLSAPEEYKLQEERFREMLEGSITSLSALQIDISVANTEVIPIEMNEELTGQNQIQLLVAENSIEMQMTNIAAVTQTIKEEYCIENIDISSQSVREIADAAEDSALSSVAAESVEIEKDSDGLELREEYINQVYENKSSLENFVAAAEEIKIDETNFLGGI